MKAKFNFVSVLAGILLGTFSFLLSSNSVAAERNTDDGIVRVFGPGGPDTAIKQAAELFTENTDIPVEVISGPESTWSEMAQQSADILFGSSEQSMTAFLQSYTAFDIFKVQPLYVRPAIIMVQDGNPRNIQSIDDLMTPGVRIVVVDGAGISNTSGTGVWEDIVGRLGQIEDIQNFRSNIAVFAPNSGTAFRTFQDSEADIDAWITWSHWHVNNPDISDAIEIAPERRIYRDANVVLAEDAEQGAALFIEFLKSDEGEAIFVNQGWIAR